jgi:hypothetical protein
MAISFGETKRKEIPSSSDAYNATVLDFLFFFLHVLGSEKLTPENRKNITVFSPKSVTDSKFLS